MPAYNSEKYIESTIMSVINQPVKVELVIVNDGSTDKMDEICRGYAERFDNINYIIVENGGAGKARNIGLKRAKGKFIMYIDSDDLYILIVMICTIQIQLMTNLSKNTKV